MKNSKNKNGLAVIFVLGALLILMILGISFITISKLGAKKEKDYMAMIKAKQAAQAGLEHAYAIIAKNTDEIISTKIWSDSLLDEWATFGKIEISLMGDPLAKYTVNIQDEESKLNINAYDPSYAGQILSPLNIDVSRMDLNRIVIPPSFYYIFPELVLLYIDPLLYPFLSNAGSVMTTRSYEYVDNFKKNIKDIPLLYAQNLFNFYKRNKPHTLLSDNEIWKICLNIISYYDNNQQLDAKDIRPGYEKDFGLDGYVFISEVAALRSFDPAYTTDVGQSGEFVELYNAYNQTVYVGDYILKNGTSSWKLGDIGISTIGPHETKVITDTTGRVSGDVQVLNFVIAQGEPVTLVYQNVGTQYILDRFETVGVNLDKSLGRRVDDLNDPRLGCSVDLDQPLTPNVAQNFAAYLGTSYFQQCDFASLTSISDMANIFRGTDAWTFLKLKSSDIDQTTAKRGDMELYELFYLYDNSIKDYFDSLDGVKKRISGKININTASNQVLLSLLDSVPDLTESQKDDIVVAIINYRKDKKFEGIGDLLFALKQVSDIDADQCFSFLANLITVRSNVFSVTVTGTYGYCRYTIKAMIDRNIKDYLDSDPSNNYPKILLQYVE